MKKLRRLLFRVQVIAYGLHAYAHTGLILYPDEPPFDTLSQLRGGFAAPSRSAKSVSN